MKVGSATNQVEIFQGFWGGILRDQVNTMSMTRVDGVTIGCEKGKIMCDACVTSLWSLSRTEIVTGLRSPACTKTSTS